jgi:phytoene synthase
MVCDQDPDRFMTALFLNPKDREAVFTVLAFNCEISRIASLVSEAMIGQIRLQWWHDRITDIYDNSGEQDKIASHKILKPLKIIIKQYGLDKLLFDRLIAARGDALQRDDVQNQDMMDQYFLDTSSPLQALIFEILQIKTDHSNEVSENLAGAWALVGTVRALPFTLRARNNPISIDILTRYGMDTKMLYAQVGVKQIDAALLQVCNHLLDMAEVKLKLARSYKGELSKNERKACLIATLSSVYIKQLRQMKCNPFDARLEHKPVMRVVKMTLANMFGYY